MLEMVLSEQEQVQKKGMPNATHKLKQATKRLEHKSRKQHFFCPPATTWSLLDRVGDSELETRRKKKEEATENEVQTGLLLPDRRLSLSGDNKTGKRVFWTGQPAVLLFFNGTKKATTVHRSICNLAQTLNL